MRLLVDTFNVLHVTGILPPALAGPDTRGLAALIATSRWGEAHVALVCDGLPPHGKAPRLPARMRTIYSGAREADEILEQLILDSSAPGRLLVVSSDRRIRRAASRRGAKDLDSPSFLRLLLEDRRAGNPQQETIHRPASLGPGEVATWRDLFKVSDGQVEITDEDLPHHLRVDPPPRPSPAKPRPLPAAPDPASVLPPDLLEEARELLRQPEAPRPREEQGTAPGEEAPRPGPTKSAADSGPMPDDIIREAEDMLRDLADPDRE